MPPLQVGVSKRSITKHKDLFPLSPKDDANSPYHITAHLQLPPPGLTHRHCDRGPVVQTPWVGLCLQDKMDNSGISFTGLLRGLIHLFYIESVCLPNSNVQKGLSIHSQNLHLFLLRRSEVSVIICLPHSLGE